MSGRWGGWSRRVRSIFQFESSLRSGEEGVDVNISRRAESISQEVREQLSDTNTAEQYQTHCQATKHFLFELSRQRIEMFWQENFQILPNVHSSQSQYIYILWIFSQMFFWQNIYDLTMSRRLGSWYKTFLRVISPASCRTSTRPGVLGLDKAVSIHLRTFIFWPWSIYCVRSLSSRVSSSPSGLPGPGHPHSDQRWSKKFKYPAKPGKMNSSQILWAGTTFCSRPSVLLVKPQESI